MRYHAAPNVGCPDASGVSALTRPFRVQELCESRGGRPGLPVLMSLMVSVKQH